MATKSVYTAARVANADVTGWLPDHAVVVDGDRIESVIPKSQLPSDVANTHEVHDLGDVSLIPGLIDAHAHMHCSATMDAHHLAVTESLEVLALRSAKKGGSWMYVLSASQA